MVIWYIFPVLECCTKKNLATLTLTQETGQYCFGEFNAHEGNWVLKKKNYDVNFSQICPRKANFNAHIISKKTFTLAGFEPGYRRGHLLTELLTALFCQGYCQVSLKSGVHIDRWFIFKPQIPIWVNFGGPNIGKCFISYGHLEYFIDIWDIL
jgi:hypothetical protein